MMDLASFGRGYGLKQFFRNSFRALHDNNITHLIIDVRSNGGGSVSNSPTPRVPGGSQFKVADSLYAVRKHGTYDRTIENHFWYNLFISIFTKKKSDGNFHFGYFERHYFNPKKNNHYTGKVYLLSAGNSFLCHNALYFGPDKAGEHHRGGGRDRWAALMVILPG
jgi:hypothetical protein